MVHACRKCASVASPSIRRDLSPFPKPALLTRYHRRRVLRRSGNIRALSRDFFRGSGDMTIRSLQALLMIARIQQDGTPLAPSDIVETPGLSSARGGRRTRHHRILRTGPDQVTEQGRWRLAPGSVKTPLLPRDHGQEVGFLGSLREKTPRERRRGLLSPSVALIPPREKQTSALFFSNLNST